MNILYYFTFFILIIVKVYQNVKVNYEFTALLHFFHIKILFLASQMIIPRDDGR